MRNKRGKLILIVLVALVLFSFTRIQPADGGLVNGSNCAYVWTFGARDYFFC